jgi:hypothetical protein
VALISLLEKVKTPSLTVRTGCNASEYDLVEHLTVREGAARRAAMLAMC